MIGHILESNGLAGPFQNFPSTDARGDCAAFRLVRWSTFHRELHFCPTFPMHCCSSLVTGRRAVVAEVNPKWVLVNGGSSFAVPSHQHHLLGRDGFWFWCTHGQSSLFYSERGKKETNPTGANFSITLNQTLILNLIKSVNHPGDASQVAVEVWDDWRGLASFSREQTSLGLAQEAPSSRGWMSRRCRWMKGV